MYVLSTFFKIFIRWLSFKWTLYEVLQRTASEPNDAFFNQVNSEREQSKYTPFIEMYRCFIKNVDCMKN